MQELWNVGCRSERNKRVLLGKETKGFFQGCASNPSVLHTVPHCHVLSTLLCARKGTKITPPNAAKNCHFSTYTSTIHSSTHTSTCQPICPSSIYSSTHLSTVHPLFIHLPTPPIHLSIHPFTYSPCIHLYIHSPIYPSIHTSTHPINSPSIH